MRRAIPFVAAVTVLAAALAAERPTSAVDVTAFEHVTVVPMDSERTLADYTVVVRGTRVVAMGPSARVVVPRGATRVDGAGRYLMPGLADMHVHPYDTDQFIDYLAHGVTTIAVLNGSPSVLRWRDAVAAGALLGPTIYTAGPSLDGARAGNPTFLSISTPEDGRRAVRQIAADGYDFIKVYMTLTPETYRAIVGEARARRIPVFGHIPPSVGVDGVLQQGGQDVVAHAEEFFRERVDSARREVRMREIAHGLNVARMAVIPNMSAYADYIRTLEDFPGVLADSEMRYASPAAFSEKIRSHNRSIRPNPDQFRAALERGLLRFHDFAKILSDSGVPLFLGTDTEIFGFAGASLHEELRQTVAAGLTPYEALAAGSRVPGDWIAQHLRREDRFGRIAVGSRADLVLLDANPLESIDNTDRIDGVMVNGRWLSRARLRQLRDSIAQRYTPMREMVQRFDSLVLADRLEEAAPLLDTLRRRDSGGTPVAEVAMWVDAVRLLPRDTAAAIRVLEWNAGMFPRSVGAQTQLASAYLLKADTARAVGAARRALAIFPMYGPALEIARLR